MTYQIQRRSLLLWPGVRAAAGLVVRQDSGITTEKDFNQKVIATPQLGNTQDIMARVWFDKKGYG